MSFESPNQLLAMVSSGGSAMPRRHKAATPVEHALHPAQFVSARRPRACRVGTTDGKVHGHHQFAIANDDHQEAPINARKHPFFLAAPPCTNQSQLRTILFEYRVIAHPGPLPAAPRGFTLAGGI